MPDLSPDDFHRLGEGLGTHAEELPRAYAAAALVSTPRSPPDDPALALAALWAVLVAATYALDKCLHAEEHEATAALNLLTDLLAALPMDRLQEDFYALSQMIHES